MSSSKNPIPKDSKKFIDNIIKERNARFKELTEKINSYSKQNKDTLKILHLNNEKYKKELLSKKADRKSNLITMYILLISTGGLFSYNFIENPSWVSFVIAVLFIIFLIYLVYKAHESLKELINEIQNSQVDTEILEEFEKTFKNNEIFKMETGFNNLILSFKTEESFWSRIILGCFVTILLAPIVFIFEFFDMNFYGGLVNNTYDMILYSGFNIGLLITLYFCSKQYTKAKNLRIENENKVAVIHGFYGLKNEKSIKINDFTQQFLDVVFTKPKFNNEKSLPVEELTKLFDIFSKFNKK